MQSGYENGMTAFTLQNQFLVKSVTYADIFDFKQWPHFLKKDAKNETFSVSKYRNFLCDSKTPEYVTASECVDGLVSHTFSYI